MAIHDVLHSPRTTSGNTLTALQPKSNTQTARNLSCVGNTHVQELTARFAKLAQETPPPSKLTDTIIGIATTDEHIADIQRPHLEDNPYHLANQLYESDTAHPVCASDNATTCYNIQSQPDAESSPPPIPLRILPLPPRAIYPERKSLLAKFLKLLTPMSLSREVKYIWGGSVDYLTQKDKNHAKPSIWESKNHRGKLGVRFPGRAPVIVKNLTEAKAFFADAKNIITNDTKIGDSQPVGILTHQLVTKYTPKLAETFAEIFRKTYIDMCSKHPNEESNFIIKKCKEEVEALDFNKIGTNKILQIVELSPTTVTMRFQPEFDRALFTGEALATHEVPYPAPTAKDKLLRFINNQPALPENDNEQFTLALRTENRGIRKPFSVDTQKVSNNQEEVEQMNVSNINKEDTGISLSHIPPVTKSYLDEIDKSTTDLPQERPPFSDAALKDINHFEHMARSDDNNPANAPMMTEIRTLFETSRKDINQKTYDGYKFLRENVPALFAMEESLNATLNP